MISPLAMEIQSSTKAVNALALDRYQNTFASAPTRDEPSTGSQAGMVIRASAAPANAPTTNNQIDAPHSADIPSCLGSICRAPNVILQPPAAHLPAVFQHKQA